MITIDDLDKDALESFFITKNYESILFPLLRQETYHPGLLLLFGQPKRIKSFFPSYCIYLNKTFAEGIEEKLSTDEPFFNAINKFNDYCIDFISYNVYKFDDGFSVPLFNCPLSALRYSMLYSLCNLDYKRKDISINIKLSFKEISFGFYSGYSNINKSIIDLLVYFNQIKSVNDILEYILRAQLANGQSLPILSNQDGVTKLIFKPSQPVLPLAYLGIKMNHKLDMHKIYALLYVSQYPDGISKDELKAAIRCSDVEFNQHLQAMLKYGVFSEVDGKVMMSNMLHGIRPSQGLSK